MTSLEERIGKLPRWAQEHISELSTRVRVLEDQLEAAETELKAGPEDSNVFAEYSEVTRPLGTDVEVSFKTDQDDYTASLKDGALHIQVVHSLVIEPVSTYEVILRTTG